MRSILLLPLVARCLETIDVCIWCMFVFMSVVAWHSRYMAVYVYNKPINHGQHVGRSINTITIQSQRL